MLDGAAYRGLEGESQGCQKGNEMRSSLQVVQILLEAAKARAAGASKRQSSTAFKAIYHKILHVCLVDF